MQCIYLESDTCRAQPLPRIAWYKPSESEMKEFCKTAKFVQCPRLAMYERFLERSLKK